MYIPFCVLVTLSFRAPDALFLQLRVDNIVIRGLKWSKLLDPDKSDQWWLSSNMAVLADNAEEVAAIIDREVSEVQKMLQLAAT